MSKRRFPVIIGIITAIVVFALCSWDPLIITHRLELVSLDMRFKLRPAESVSNVITNIDIDDASIDKIGRWPWPRDVHAYLLNVLNDLGASCIVFDVEFPEASKPAFNFTLDNTANSSTETVIVSATAVAANASESSSAATSHAIQTDEDAAFANSIQEAENVYLAYNVSQANLNRLQQGKTLITVSNEYESRVRAELRNDFYISPKELANKLQIPQSDVEGWLYSAKEEYAFNRSFDIVSANPDTDVENILHDILPDANSDETSAEVKLIKSAFFKAKSTFIVLERATIKDDLNDISLEHAHAMTPPFHTFAQGARGFGFVNVSGDFDGVLRRVTPFVRYKKYVLTNLSLSVAIDYFGIDKNNIYVNKDNVLVMKGSLPHQPAGENSITIPLDDKGNILLDWPNPRGEFFETFNHVSYAAVVEFYQTSREVEQNYRYLDAAYGTGKRTFLQDKLDELQKSKNEMPVEEYNVQQNALEKAIDDEESSLVNSLKHFIDLGRKQLANTADETKKRDLEKKLDKLSTDYSIVAERLDRYDRLSRYLRPLIAGKICIVGAAFTGATDFYSTPVAPAYPGMAAHSVLLNMILENHFLTRAPVAWNVAIVFILTVVVILLSSFLNAIRGGVLSLVAVIAYVVIAYIIFAQFSVWCDVARPVATAVFTFVIVTSYRQLTEEKDKRFIQKAFKQYLSPDVVAEITKRPDMLKLGGEKKVLTVFFSDIAGFTSLSEKLSVEGLVSLLNEYMTEMTDIILKHGGCLDKYEGDAIIAFFGAPAEMADHAARACLTALEYQEHLKEMRFLHSEQGLPEISARIGINTGEMIVGNVGSKDRFDYTVLGDSVNLGSRLEQANKLFGTHIIIGQGTYEMVKDAVETRCLGLLKAFGKEQKVKVYELLAQKGRLTGPSKSAYEAFNGGLELFLKGDFANAIRKFNKTLEIIPDDAPAKLYIEHSRRLSSEGTPPDWDGSIAMETK